MNDNQEDVFVPTEENQDSSPAKKLGTNNALTDLAGALTPDPSAGQPPTDVVGCDCDCGDVGWCSIM
jgi:hypothetical protein